MKVKKINPIEAGFTGNEPQWYDWQNWTSEKFFSEYHRAFRFYNYYCNAKDLIPDILNWMSGKYSKKDQQVVKNSNISIVVGALCRCLNNGLPSENDVSNAPEGTTYAPLSFVQNEIDNVLKSQVVVKNDSSNSEVKRVSPLVHLENKVNSTIISDLEELLDLTIENKDIKGVKFDLYRKMREHELPAKANTFVWNWLTLHYNELIGAYDKTDEDLVEGYSHLTRAQLKQRIRLFEKMYKDLEMFVNSQKTKRKPRKKKVQSVAKQVEKLKYKNEDIDYQIQSVQPHTILGAKRIFTFNTKNRTFNEYVSNSADGFAVKGTTLQNIDDEKSRSTKLRKPEEFLPIAIKNAMSKYNKTFDALTTKVNTPNGRINSDTVILRTFDK